jgi:ribosomal protein S18 acetylase RimI-like enzyme
LDDIAAIAMDTSQFFDEGKAYTRKELSSMANLRVMEATAVSPLSSNRAPRMIVGYMSWECRDGKAELVALAVRVGFRRLGLGSQLLIPAIKAALRYGATYLMLQVRLANEAARALYESCGFKAVSHLPKYYSGRYPGLLMRLTLSAEVEKAVGEMELAAGSRRVTGCVGGFQVSASSRDAWAMLAYAMEQAAPAVKRRGWPLREVVEAPLHATRCGVQLQGFNVGDGRVLVCLKSSRSRGIAAPVAPYREVLATLLHELAHFEHLGHRSVFYSTLGALLREVTGEAGQPKTPQSVELSSDVSEHIAHTELAQRPAACRNAFYK